MKNTTNNAVERGKRWDYRSNGIDVVQNIAWHERLLRIVIGVLMLVIPIALMTVQSAMAVWMPYVMLLSVYPLLTGIMGFDVFYTLLGVKTCGVSNRNQCGSLPFEVDAALGRNPISCGHISNELRHSRHAG